MLRKNFFNNIKENYQVRRGGDIEVGGNKKEKEKDRMFKTQEARWLLPPEGWHKANFDRASKGNPGSLGSGGIIRNEFGEGIATFSQLTTLRKPMLRAILSNWLLKSELLIFGLKGIRITL